MVDRPNPLEGLTSADLGYQEPAPRREPERRASGPQRMSREDATSALQGLTSADLGYAEKPPISPGQDVRSAIVSGAQNIPIGIVGLPGTVSDLLRTGVGKAVEKGEELFHRGSSYLRGETGSPEAEARLREMRERHQAGREILERQPRLPTGTDIGRFVQPYAEAAGITGPMYEPSSTLGKYAKTITEFAGPGLLGKQKAFQTAVGAITGAGSETAGQAASGLLGVGPEAEAAARVVSALAIGRYAPSMVQTGRNIYAPTAGAEAQLAREIASARAGGKAPSDTEIQTALAEIRQRAQTATGTPGEQLMAYDLLGKQGVKAAERGLASSEGRAAADLIDDFLKTRQAESTARLDAAFNNIYGGNIQTAGRRTSMQTGIDVDNPALFKAARSSKEAQNVQSTVTDSLRADPLAAEAISAASRTLRGAAPDNLTFWHEVKTNLDYMVDRAFKNNDGLLGRQLSSIRDNLRNDLKTTVPSYAKALDEASGFFKGRNAIDSGINFAGGRYNLTDLQEARRAYTKYGPDQKRQFEEAYLYQLRENAKRATGSTVVPNLQAEYEKMAALFGRAKADRLYAVATAEDVINLKKAIDFNKAAGLPGLISGTALPGAGVAFGGLSSFLIAPTTVGLAGAGISGAAAVRRLALNAEERAIVGRINRILASNDPDQIARLSRMAERNKNVNSVLDKYKLVMSQDLARLAVQAGPSVERALEPSESSSSTSRPINMPVARKSGGRVMSAQHMVAAADRAKKAISGKTEALLKSSDETVAKALEIAKQNLEG